MIGTRHVGYFMLHTVKPMMEELDKILEKCNNIKIDSLTLDLMIKDVINLEIKKSIIYCITYIIISLILGGICYVILR